MPDPRTPVVCCSDPACGRELIRAERHAAHETAGRCTDCADAAPASLATTARVLKLLAESCRARHIEHAVYGVMEAS